MADFEYDEIDALDTEGALLFNLMGDFRVEASWEDGGWVLDRAYAWDGKSRMNPQFNRIDDRADCQSIVRALQAKLDREDAPEGVNADPNAEHRLGAVHYGVGR